MKIWYFSAHDQPRGQSSRTYDFSKELVQRGHDVTMFTNSYCHWTHVERLALGEKWRIEDVDGIRVVWLRTIHYRGNGVGRGANMISNAVRSVLAARRLSVRRPDVVIGPSVPLGTGWAAKRIAAKYGAAFVFEVRDVWPIALVYDGSLRRQNPIYLAFRILEKQLYRKAQRISATMPFLFEHVAESGGNPKHVTWIPNGVSLERFSGFDTYNGGRSFPLTAMYVGGFGAAHDVITIVRSARLLQEMGEKRIRFAIIGDGVKRGECEREAKQFGLENIEFRNPIPKEEIPRTQMESDILLACVLDSDAYRFGLNLNKVYDYFASSRPVIFSGNAPNDPIAESGAGFSIRPQNPDLMVNVLLKLLEMSPQERSAMGQKGRRYVEKEFDMLVLGERMERLLLEVIGERRA